MPSNLELLLERTHTRLRGLKRQIDELPHGRGGEWKALLGHVLGEFTLVLKKAEEDLARAATAGERATDAMAMNVAQHLERVQLVLDDFHEPITMYRESVARSDVPVGLQHLIDILMEKIVIGGGDPIIHLDGINEYSTIDLTAPVNELIRALGPTATPYAGKHPIAFNLPALDPNNALLAPVLAHEVAHTVVKQKLLTDLEERVDASPVGADIQAALTKYEENDQEAAEKLRSDFQSWSTELICDATAIAVTGPSFLLALTAALVPPSSPTGILSHPPMHDRLRFALALAEELGWAEFMRGRAPGIMEWLSRVAAEELLDGSQEESFLRWAIEQTHDFRRSVAFGHVESPFRRDGRDERIDHAVGWLAQGVPMVDIDGEALTPWQTVLAGWLAAIRVHGDTSGTIVRAAGDPDYNGVIVKALEYSQIVTAWRMA